MSAPAARGKPSSPRGPTRTSPASTSARTCRRMRLRFCRARNDRPGIAAGEEMPLERGERPLEVATEKRLGRLEEITFRDIGRELGDMWSSIGSPSST